MSTVSDTLPGNVKPKHYAIYLTPNVRKKDYHCNVIISIEVKHETNSITLHGVNLDIKKVTVKKETEEYVPVSIHVKEQEEMVQFKFNKSLMGGFYTLHIEYFGTINAKPVGLFYVVNRSKTDKDEYILGTQFFATHARRCFPCWDEPRYRASFEISLVVPESLVALSNMPVKDTVKKTSNRTEYIFETSPLMPTAYVAIIMGHFDFIEETTTFGTLVRIHAPKGKTNQCQFALDVASRVLEYFAEYLQVPYTLKKLDVVAIEGFAFSNMNNWGLILCSEAFLLQTEEARFSPKSKEKVAATLSNAICHQWFGNLVTVESWQDYWLIEGFSMFFQYKCVDHFFPNFGIWQQFVVNMYTHSLKIDSMKNRHPIEVKYTHTSDIDFYRDPIIKSKSSVILRMLQYYVGTETFQSALSLYIQRHQFKTATTKDLWMVMEEASKKPVSIVMQNWIIFEGYPVVDVLTKVEGEKSCLLLTQNPFTMYPLDDSETVTWGIPICVSSMSRPGREILCAVMNTKEHKLLIPNIGSMAYLYINPNSFGYYRIRYPQYILDKFVATIKNRLLPPIDIMGLLDDLRAFAKEGCISTIEVLKMLNAMTNETDYSVWLLISDVISEIGIIMGFSNNANIFAKYVRWLYNQIFLKLGWEPKVRESHLDTNLRTLVISKLVMSGDEEILKEAIVRYNKHRSSGPFLSVDLKVPVYKAIIRAGPPDSYESLLKSYFSTDNQREKLKICDVLGSTTNLENMRQNMQLSISDEIGTRNGSVILSSTINSSTEGCTMAWQFFKDNWPTHWNKYDSESFGKVLEAFQQSMGSFELADDAGKFFKQTTSSCYSELTQRLVEDAQIKCEWLKRDSEDIKKYLLDKFSS